MRPVMIFLALAAAGQVFAQPAPKVDERIIVQMVGSNLKDPESLKLRNVKLHRTDDAGVWHLCGEYNAKNSYGGYAGFEYFVGSVSQEGRAKPSYVIRDMGDFARSFCTSLPAG